jgi:hypothetical protein
MIFKENVLSSVIDLKTFFLPRFRTNNKFPPGIRRSTMAKQYLKEEFEVLEELLRKAYDLIHDEKDDYSYLADKDMRERLHGKYPKCFLKLLPIGRNTSGYILPLCNLGGIEDPKVVGISLQVVKRMIDGNKGSFDTNELQNVMNRLQHKHNVLSKNIPKPATTASKKGQVTKMLSRIQSDIFDFNKTGSMEE